MKQLLTAIIAALFATSSMIALAQTPPEKGKDGKAVSEEKKADPAEKGKDAEKKKGQQGEAKKKSEEPVPAPTTK